MKKDITTIRRWLVFFMIALFISGVTAIPAETELAIICKHFSPQGMLGGWLHLVSKGVTETNNQYPFIAYGYDWLAFAHMVLAILFIGPYRDPVRNKWVVEFGMIACLLIIPFAFIAGQVRGIPLGWRLIDCSFGVIGLLPLSISLKKIIQLEALQK